MRKFAGFAAIASAAALISCGYHVGGKAVLMPKGMQTIAIPAFHNVTTYYKLSDALPEEIGREFLARTHYRVVNNPADADAVLQGTISRVIEAPIIFDPASGSPSSAQILVFVSMKMVERATGRVLYSSTNTVYHENYAYANDPHQYFDESGPALIRLDRNLARDLVSSILEDF
ncbi:MAG: LPS assembly lipoprotein LptE [Bryobacteraceae bacterium]